MTAQDEAVQRLLAEARLPPAYRETVEKVARPLAERLDRLRGDLARPVVLGLCGAQGSGKSTLGGVVAGLLERRGRRTAVLSIDDLYLSRERRRAMAEALHPLFATRGPPGGHDVELGLATLDRLTGEEGPVALPRFDKAADDPLPPEDWPVVEGPMDVVVLEGWMVGARPEPPERLAEPVNALEREEDAEGRWRRAANAALAGAYQALFARIDLLVFLRAPGFMQVFAWRRLQERRLAERLAREGASGEVMDDAALRRFIAHYERLTRWTLEEMPGRADVVVDLGPGQEVRSVRGLGLG